MEREDHSESRDGGRAVPATALLWIGAALGVSGDVLMRVPPPVGLNLSVWVAAVAVAAYALHRRQMAADRERGIWLATVVLFAAGLAWRDSDVLKLLAVAGATCGFALAAYRPSAAWVRRAGVTRYVRAWATGALHAWTAAATTLMDVYRSRRVEARRTPQWQRASAIGRGLAIAVPLLVVFGVLFIEADAVFARLVRESLRFDVERIGSHLLLFAVSAWLATGYLRGFLTGTELPPLQHEGEWIPLVSSRPALRITELATALSAVNLLFLCFVIVQFRHLFGGDALVQITPDLTYAQYARRGFFELVFAVALVVPILLAADWLLVRDHVRDDVVFRWLAGVQIALVIAIAASALQRVRLYVDSYGLTDDRFYALALLAWIGVVLMWFSATVLRRRRESFAFGALVAGLVTVAVLFAINPDAIIARTNLARLTTTETAVPFDVTYASTLSVDAVPVLIDALPGLSAGVQCALAERLLRRWPPEGERPLRSWSWSASRASAAVRHHAASLRAIVGPTGRCAPPATPVPDSAAPSQTEVATVVDAIVRARLAHPQGPASVSVAIVRAGETLVDQAWGTANVSAGRPATAAATYRLGSISKQFTAALILQLVDRGTLKLDDSVADTLGRHVSGLRPEWRPITIEQLLNHTSGLPRDYRQHVVQAVQALLNPTDTARLEWAAQDPMVFAPGTQHLYSNTGYMLLGMLVEKLHRKPYGEVVRDEIAAPLGLTTLGPCTAPEKRATEATGHIRDRQGKLQAASELITDLLVGGGGLCATAGDLARWNAALHGGRVLSPTSYDAMITPRGAAIGDRYGFGIRSLRMSWGGPVLTHDGTTIAFVSENSWFPDERLSVTVLYNSTAGPGTSPLAAQLARVALGHTLPQASATGRDAFVGFYEGRPGRGVIVTLEKDTLYAQPTDGGRQPLVRHEGTTFHVGSASASLGSVTFVVGIDGRPTAMILRQGTNERTFPKVR